MSATSRSSTGHYERRPSGHTLFNDDGDVVVVLRGDYDSGTVSELGAHLAVGMRRAATHLVVDMSAVSFMDSAAVRVLERAAASLVDRRRVLVVRHPSVRVMRALELCGALDLLAIHTGPCDPACALSFN